MPKQILLKRFVIDNKINSPKFSKEKIIKKRSTKKYLGKFTRIELVPTKNVYTQPIELREHPESNKKRCTRNNPGNLIYKIKPADVDLDSDLDSDEVMTNNFLTPPSLLDDSTSQIDVEDITNDEIVSNNFLMPFSYVTESISQIDVGSELYLSLFTITKRYDPWRINVLVDNHHGFNMHSESKFDINVYLNY